MKEVLETLDENIGARLRSRRKLLGFSPNQFASIIGISHQQLNKYETGVNRISASQLAKMAKLLNVEINYFMKNGTLPFYVPDSIPFKAAEVANQPETKNLIKNFISINDPRVRAAVVELVTSITKSLSKRASS